MKHLQNPPPGRNGNCGIIPPHILESIARNGTEMQRAAAQRTLAHDEQLRSQRTMKGRTVKSKTTSSGIQGNGAQGIGAAHKNRLTYTANSTYTEPGTIVRSEGQGASGDVAIDEAYDGLGATFDLYWDIYGRNSIDDYGKDLIGTVHYGSGYDNAFFDGSQMVFGDGDGVYFNRFTISIDVIGHELTHGVTASTAALEYHDQPGALNESVSDVFGSLVKQRSLGQTADQADWLIGAGLWTAAVNGVALRSMKAPGTAYDDPVMGKDPQPDHMSRYVTTASDNGGVHTNSGIPNKAFYLAAINIGGYAWDVAGNIWYKTLLDSRLTTGAQFQDFANLTANNAFTLYGASVQSAVIQAWHDVGIDVNEGWLTNKEIIGLWSIDQDRNAWVYVNNDGWKKIAYDNDNIFYDILNQLVSAKASAKTASLNISSGVITQVYVNP